MTTKTTYKYMITTTLLITATLLIQSCNKPTEPAKESISVTVEDVSCTEAWLKISDTNANPDITVIVKRDDTDILTLNLNKADTVIVDENLLPNKSYTYRAVKQQGSNVVEASKPVTAVTLDTTSHNFTWQTFEFGEHSNSVLYDVAIIDENNIWAVGEIYMKDSLGNYDPIIYNIVKWNGINWKPERVYFVNGQGQSFLAPMKSIFAFDANNIWIGLDQVIKWNGENYQSFEISHTIFHSWINKIWGASNNDIYIIGNGGNIAHWDGSSWKKIESGTTNDIKNIIGIATDNKNCFIYMTTGEALLKIDSKNTLIKINANEQMLVHSVWGTSNNKIFTAGKGVVALIKEKWEKVDDPVASMVYTINGENYNNIYGLGSNYSLVHFNGVDWNVVFSENYYIGLQIAVKKNQIATVGWKEDYAFITLIKRND
jgi:hypothetical protein